MADKDTVAHQQETHERLQELVDKFSVGMLTTSMDGRLQSRPMTSNGEGKFDGDLWFFTYGTANVTNEIRGHQDVNVAFADHRNHIYISLSGKAVIVRDRAKIQELWRPSLEVWFPKGLEELDLVLLKVDVEHAEYWDGSKNVVAQVVEIVKGLLTKRTPDLGDNEKLVL